MNLEDRQRRNRMQILTEPAYDILSTDCLDGVLIFRNGDPVAKPVPMAADAAQTKTIEKGLMP